MSAVATLDRTRLARVCGLLGSAFDGERAAAAATADRLVRTAGLTWLDLLSPAQPECTQHRRPSPPPARDILARHRANLSAWEAGFLESLTLRRKPLTDRQRAVLSGLQSRFSESAAP